MSQGVQCGNKLSAKSTNIPLLRQYNDIMLVGWQVNVSVKNFAMDCFESLVTPKLVSKKMVQIAICSKATH